MVDSKNEKTCEATVRNVFPGSAYKVPKTIFDLLEDDEFTFPKS